MKFSEVKEYLVGQGLKPRIDFRIHESLELVEFHIDYVYFCSVGKWTEDPIVWELFENAHGVEWDEDGNALTDGEIWQYAQYKSLKVAIDKAIKYKKEGKLPEYPLRRW